MTRKYFASDATETQIAALEMANPSNQEIKPSQDNILVNELKAALLSLDMASQRLDEAYFDSFIAGEHLPKSKGRVKWSLNTISIFRLFKILKTIEVYRESFPFVAVYIPFGSNPADDLSRKQILGAPSPARTFVFDSH